MSLEIGSQPGTPPPVRVEVNSLLLPPVPYDPDQESITWDVMFNSDYARLSSRLPSRSWNDACEEPCTSPLVHHVRLCSPCFPWVINVENPQGVTCGDILDSLHAFMERNISSAQFEALPTSFQTSIDVAYRQNRKTPRGKRFYGIALRRGEILRSFTVWNGLVQNDKYVRETLGSQPGVTLIVLLKASSQAEVLPISGDLDATLLSVRDYYFSSIFTN